MPNIQFEDLSNYTMYFEIATYFGNTEISDNNSYGS